MKVKIYADGACSGNPGPSGWAMVFNTKDGCQCFSGNLPIGTNNQMELMAVCECLKKILQIEHSFKAVNGKRTTDAYEIYSDSAYVVNGINNSRPKAWKLLDWKTKRNEDIKNKDLWMQVEQLLEEVEKREYDVRVIKIKGHTGNTFNELVDSLAKQESAKAKMWK